MSRPALSAVPISAPQNPTSRVRRHVADYHPSVWGDHFLKYSSDSMATISSLSEQVQALKEDVKNILTVNTDTPSQKLELIDAIQRLGVAYHFEQEIAEALENVYTHQDCDNTDDDLYTVALRFRLLRQHGYDVSSNTFKKFKNDKDDEDLVSDVRGLLCLYEASHLSVHGEDILDEALAFTAKHLESMATKLSPAMAEQVSHALNRPMRKSLTRLEARYNISLYQTDDKEHINEALLKLAKLDFNLVQMLHQQELSAITKWWKDLDFARKLPFARDRVTECYFWPLGVFFEPKFGPGRIKLTKVIAVFSVIDDIYDAFGTLEELELFTKVIDRFDMSMMDQMPNYMKVCYQALLDLFSDIEQDLAKEGRSHFISYAKEATKKLARAYLVEAKWFHANAIPNTEEYIRNGLITSVYPLLIITSFYGMADITSKEVFDWISTEPKIVKAASTICRLMDDIVSHKFEQSRGHVASAVECYMTEHNVTDKQAYDELDKIVAAAWKDINEELLLPTAAPMPLLSCILNFAKVIDVVYKDEDSYTHSKTALKDTLVTMLLNPLAI